MGGVLSVKELPTFSVSECTLIPGIAVPAMST